MPEANVTETHYEHWLAAVLRQNRSPAWLTGDAPHNDVAISSRARLMRNLAGSPFPSHCTREQLEQVRGSVLQAISPFGTQWEERRDVSAAERAILVGSRLVSPDFAWKSPGRAVLVSDDRMSAVMVNEEDHLRVQAVTAGFSAGTAEAAAQAAESQFGASLAFAKTAAFGFLAASVANSGGGNRLGVMLHLPALAADDKAGRLIEAAEGGGLEVRGLMGERSHGVAAYLQISATGSTTRKLNAVVRHLIDRERESRLSFSEDRLADGIQKAKAAIKDQSGLNLIQAIRCLGWLRFGSVRGLADHHPRELDALLALVCIRDPDEPTTNRRRALLLRRYLKLTFTERPS